MSETSNLLRKYVSVLKQRAMPHAYIGMGIGSAGVILATMGTAVIDSGMVTMSSLVSAQANHVSLWVLDLMPFVFAFWGQYVSVVMAHEAGAIVLDATENLRLRNQVLEQASEHSTRRDNVTGLVNRFSFLDLLQKTIEETSRQEREVGLLVVNLDGFRAINEKLGQVNGDFVLQHVGRRLRRAASDRMRIARIGADSYGVLVPRIGCERELARYAERINDALQAPCTLANVRIDLSASIGGAVCPDHAIDAPGLLNCADIAMRDAKAKGSNFVIYQARGKDAPSSSLSLNSELREAIAKGQLALHLQPVIECGSERLLRVEALVRWSHPEHGLIEAGEFIPHVRQPDVMRELTRWVIRDALTKIRGLREADHEIGISVNISHRTLLAPGFANELASFLERYGVPGECLTFEVGEDALVSEVDAFRRALSEVRELGVGVSIDSFGQGYSQLAYLTQMPMTEIKIGRMFTSQMLTSVAAEAVVAGTISIAKTLGVRVVGEGVENEEQAVMLQELGCSALQGFYFGRPMVLQKLHGWIDEWQAVAQVGLDTDVATTSEAVSRNFSDRV